MQTEPDDPVVQDALEQRQRVKESIETALGTDLSETTIAWKDPGARVYDALDAVPWGAVAWVTSSHGDSVGIDASGFAVWITGPRTGDRIPINTHGPWRGASPSPEVLAAVETLANLGINGAMFERLRTLDYPTEERMTT